MHLFSPPSHPEIQPLRYFLVPGNAIMIYSSNDSTASMGFPPFALVSAESAKRAVPFGRTISTKASDEIHDGARESNRSPLLRAELHLFLFPSRTDGKSRYRRILLPIQFRNTASIPDYHAPFLSLYSHGHRTRCALSLDSRHVFLSIALSVFFRFRDLRGVCFSGLSRF